ncbi:MAG: restriction endonuclease [Planctomycetota bacterium]
MAKPTQSFPLLDTLRDGPAWLGPAFALLVYLSLGVAVPLVLEAALPHQQNFVRLGQVGGACFAALIFATWFAARFQRRGESRRLNAIRTIDDVRALTPERFEALLSEAFRRQGYEAQRRGDGAPDGGVDVWLNRDGKATLVQCKRWTTKNVGVPTVRELLGVVTSEGTAEGIVVSSSGFTADARRFAASNPIRLIDGEELLRMLQGVQTEPGTPTEPSEATAMAMDTPRCPNCGAPMVRRVAKRGLNAGQAVFGCSTYPKCRGTRGRDEAQ